MVPKEFINRNNNIYIPEAGAVVTAEAAATVAAWVTAGLVLYTVGFLSYTSFYNHIQKLLVYLQPKKYISNPTLKIFPLLYQLTFYCKPNKVQKIYVHTSKLKIFFTNKNGPNGKYQYMLSQNSDSSQMWPTVHKTGPARVAAGVAAEVVAEAG